MFKYTLSYNYQFTLLLFITFVGEEHQQRREQLTNSYITEVEKFYSNEWKSFKEKVEAAKLSWFRD